MRYLIPLLLVSCSGNSAPTFSLVPATQAASNVHTPRPAGPSKTPVSTGKSPSYKDALNKGRSLHLEGDFGGAAAAFTDALSAKPDDPQALDERGYAELFGKNYTAAEKDTRKVITLSTEKNLLASAYYNLGIIQEAQDKPEDALASYQESIKIRPNKEVKARYDTLKAGKGLKVKKLKGPFADVASFCKKWKAKAIKDGCDECKCPAKELSNTKEGDLEASYLRVQGPEESVLLFLAIKTSAGWYVEDTSVPQEESEAGMSKSFDRTTKIEDLAIKDVIPGGSSEVIAHLKTTEQYDCSACEPLVTTMTNYDFLEICGVGSSGVPSCTGPLYTQGALSYDFTAKGALVLISKAIPFTEFNPYADIPKRFYGTFSMVFP
jgi:hypothetical protein